ncbi:conserved hypothetical protein [Trichinella spiralis]|uniref:hypothetical protein n=1 Tax=Trichinella spiralis TaxID=6334 RepID=UPI0001EFB2F6|nr:conserved hypothetical protein [Trichinella spiralis]
MQPEHCEAERRTASYAHRRHPERASENSGSAHLTWRTWQVEVDEVDHEKMASSTPLSNQFQFKRLIEPAISGLIRKTCFVYLDDIILFRKTEENLERLAEVLHRLQSIGLKIRSTNAPRCVIHGTHSVVKGHRHWIQNQSPKDETKGFFHRQFKYGRVAFLVYEKIHYTTVASVVNL